MDVARLRTFCALNATLFFLVAMLIVAMRPLLAAAMAEPLDLPGAQFAQELVGACALIAFGALLLSVRGALTDPATLPLAVRRGRVAKVVAVVAGLATLIGLGAVVLAAGGETLPTVLVSCFVLVAAVWTYTGAAKLPR